MRNIFWSYCLKFIFNECVCVLFGRFWEFCFFSVFGLFGFGVKMIIFFFKDVNICKFIIEFLGLCSENMYVSML